MPALAGRIAVCTTSLTVSTTGTLSSTTSTSSSTAPMPMAHHDSIHSQPAGSTRTSVKRATSATARNGM